MAASKKKKSTNTGKMRVNGIQCPRCEEKIWSRHRHDFRYCICEYCYVDGGFDYLRYGWGVSPRIEYDAQGNLPPEEFDWIREQNDQIGQPKVVTMYVPKIEKKESRFPY